MKTILISIHPKWVKKILSGEKTMEVRKAIPKCELPFKGLIYCTKGKPNLYIPHEYNCFPLDEASQPYFAKEPTLECDYLANGKVVAEFIVNEIQEYESEFDKDNNTYQDIQIVYRDDEEDKNLTTQFVVTSIDEDSPNDCELLKKSCLTFEEIKEYMGVGFKTFYALHVTELKVYDKPKELGEFKKVTHRRKYHKKGESKLERLKNSNRVVTEIITKAPQNFVYVEERK